MASIRERAVHRNDILSGRWIAHDTLRSIAITGVSHERVVARRVEWS